MNKILQDLNDVLDRAKTLSEDYEDKLKEIADQQSDLDQREATLKASEDSFQAREAAVLAIEDVVQMKADAEALGEKNRQGAQDLADAKVKWLNDKAIQEQLLDNQRIVVAQASDNNEVNRKALEAKMKTFDDQVDKRVTEIVSRLKVN